MTSFRVDECLDKMNSRDKDFRYMAVSDLINEIAKDNFKLDADSEKKIINKLLEMVAKDGSGDVKALAVKALGPLATRAQESQVQNMIDKLGGYLLDEGMPDDIRDVSSIGLKTVIAEIPDTQVATIKLIIKLIATRLVDVIAKKETKPEVVQLCLDLMNDLLGRWGKEMAKQKPLLEKIQKSVILHLTSSQSAARKKAIGCLSYLCLSTPDDLFSDLCVYLIREIDKTSKLEHIKTFISAIGAISRAVGYRLGKFLDNIIPLLFQYVDKSNEDDEVREFCFQVFESVLLRCPKETDPYLEKIQTLCLKYISYDPNFAGSSDDDKGADDMELSQEGSDDFDDGEYNFSDDDDMSWKVRKGSVRCIMAIIKTRPERLEQILTTISPTLVKRFKEREETVKLDIFSAFVEILKQICIVGGNEKDSKLSRKIVEQVPSIVSTLTKELKSKSLKTRPGVFLLLAELVTVVPGCLEKHVGSFLPGIESSLNDKNTTSSLKIDALVFLRVLLQNHTPTAFHPHLSAIITPVYKAVDDKYYKITAEGLRVCSQISRILPVEGFNYASYVPQLYRVMLERLKLLDIDQEVKEASIECAGNIISLLGDKIEADLPECLKILVDRLGNEVTRLVTIKVFEQMASSKVKVDLSPLLAEILKHLSSFLRKHNRQLKQATLSCLSALVKAYGKSKSASALYETVLKELASIISDQDLHLSHLAIRAASSILHVHKRSAEKVKVIILPQCHELLKSSLLQGLALESLLALYKELVISKAKISTEVLLSGLTGVASQPLLSKQAYHSIAQCVAVVVAKQEEAVREPIVSKFVSEIQSSSKESERLLALYCVAEIGRRVDISSNPSLKKNILLSFDNSSEDIKTAASVSLGCVSVGNMAKLFPDILTEVNANPKREYLLLGSLREVIVRLSSSKGKSKLSKFSENLLELLLKHTTTDEEGTRNVVSECLGKLALIEPNLVVNHIVSHLSSLVKDHSVAGANARACLVTSLKSALSDKSSAVDNILAPKIDLFLNLLSDETILVRKSALLSLNFCAHHKPALILDLLPKYLPVLYGETKVKKELIREVDLGPFKHKVDDGIELRQAAFETMYTLLDTSLARLDLQVFIEQLSSGLGDVYDIQMLNHLILARLAKKAPAALVAGLDNLVEPLRAAVTSKPKEAAVKQQVERNEELIRSTLRAIVAISKIEGIESAVKFQDFLRSTVLQASLNEKYEALLKEHADK